MDGVPGAYEADTAFNDHDDVIFHDDPLVIVNGAGTFKAYDDVRA